MSTRIILKSKLCVLGMATSAVVILFFWMSEVRTGPLHLHAVTRPPAACPGRVSEETITRLNGTEHLLVSAYADGRERGEEVRIIAIFKRDSVQKLNCVSCCQGCVSAESPARVLVHRDHFGFPYGATSVLCQASVGCRWSHVALVAPENHTDVGNLMWLPIRNWKEAGQEERRLPYNFTVCMSVLFGNYNNALQMAQTLETYRLLGVDKVVVYNFSIGPELARLLRSYSQEGFVEIIPWPIDRHLKPASAWRFSNGVGDLEYFGQVVALNDCLYRSMERSRYIMVNDQDEIIMPYRHDDLMSMMSELQRQHPDVSEFHIEAHRFPTTMVEPNGTFQLPQWEGVPGINILRHIYSLKPNGLNRSLGKSIIRPRLVKETSVHQTNNKFGTTYYVPPNVCRIIHIRDDPPSPHFTVDRRLWDFQKKLIPNLEYSLKRAGLIKT
ncbi:glycosyltransferase family 92 protein F59C6.8-like [Phycodurus eques]|uniref:glycosyltransferase family 92 protein F59C6.8-like n=1 Tax=Phycodurus eques TaxID=693459 RepID=UPI002ACDC789|nr:glycosyltransferase family 92 protein F59C6.8-like [Phycodurus eques]XP_061553335.1 glycosyltransferase family 92 protein F59C6.8-like [Phycodurus eques]XP_061553336.1 glycosyltransferase family 92 protein F59C6.8-like [Phycodurus eques]XP_061553337.1 glycosyltransferase family 92 protein F59C6.8-like [Phycodurus eques]